MAFRFGREGAYQTIRRADILVTRKCAYIILKPYEYNIRDVHNKSKRLKHKPMLIYLIIDIKKDDENFM